MVRRVVTGIKNGKSIIVKDDEVTNIDHPFSVAPDHVLHNMWETGSDEEDPTERPLSILPPKDGTNLRIIDFPPDATFIHKLGNSPLPGADAKSNRHPLMHKTPTIDYIIILSGEIHLIMDEGETLLKPFDVVIQRETNHAWSNRSKVNCRMAAILIAST